MTQPIDQLLRGSMSTVFQPMYDVRGDQYAIWALEALTRGPAGTHFSTPSIFFEYVRLRHEEVRVDRFCIANAFARMAALDGQTRLSVNVHAITLERDATFVSFIESAAVATDLDPSSLILELVEHSSYFDPRKTLRVLRDLRSLGIAIALDDLGLGHGNFRTILDAQPEYLKVDRYFVDGVSGDPRRQSLIASALQIARDFGAIVVAEGVEDPADLTTLQEMGVPLVQGYLLATPSAEPSFAAIDAHAIEPWSEERKQA